MPTIGVIAGDGVGPEVVRGGPGGARRVAAGATASGTRLVPFDLGGERYLKTGEVLPDRRARRAPPVRRHPPRRGRPSRACLRACSRRGSCSGSGSSSTSTSTSGRSGSIPGVETPIKGKGPDDIDLVVVRENNEDLYVGAGGFTRKGTPEEVAIQTSINTRAGVERCLRLRVRPGPVAGHGRARSAA